MEEERTLTHDRTLKDPGIIIMGPSLSPVPSHCLLLPPAIVHVSGMEVF